MSVHIFLIEPNAGEAAEFKENIQGRMDSRVTVAHSDVDAMTMLDVGVTPDVMIFVWGGGDVRGEALYHALRGRFPEIPIIVTLEQGSSAPPTKGDVVFQGLLRKPYNYPQIPSVLREVMGGMGDAVDGPDIAELFADLTGASPSDVENAPPGSTGPIGAGGSPDVTGPIGTGGQPDVTGPIGAGGQPDVAGPIGTGGSPDVTGPIGTGGQLDVTGPIGAGGSPDVTGPIGTGGSPDVTGPIGTGGSPDVTGPIGTPPQQATPTPPMGTPSEEGFAIPTEFSNRESDQQPDPATLQRFDPPPGSDASPALHNHITLSDQQVVTLIGTLREIGPEFGGLPAIISQDGQLLTHSNNITENIGAALARDTGHIWRAGATRPSREWLCFDERVLSVSKERRGKALYSIYVAGDVSLSLLWEGEASIGELRNIGQQAAYRLSQLLILEEDF